MSSTVIAHIGVVRRHLDDANVLTLIETGEVYAPEPLGKRSVLLVDGRIGKVGDVDRCALETLGVVYRVVDAEGCVVAPGPIDPHSHLLHVGEHPQRLSRMRELLDGDWAVEAEMLYPTHVERSPELMDEAIDLVKRGAHADIDVVEEDLHRWVRYWLDHGGDPTRLTISSDSGASTTRLLYEQLCNGVVEYRLPLELMLRLATENTANVLELERKGRIEKDRDSDVLIMRRGSLEIVHVVARGKFMGTTGA